MARITHEELREKKLIQRIADEMISVHNIDKSPLEIASQILALIKQNYVRLAKDQSLPKIDPHDYSTGCPMCGEELGTAGEVEMGM